MRLAKLLHEGKVVAVASTPMPLIRYARLRGLTGTWLYLDCPRYLLNIIKERKLLLHDF